MKEQEGQDQTDDATLKQLILVSGDVEVEKEEVKIKVVHCICSIVHSSLVFN